MFFALNRQDLGSFVHYEKRVLSHSDLFSCGKRFSVSYFNLKSLIEDLYFKHNIEIIKVYPGDNIPLSKNDVVSGGVPNPKLLYVPVDLDGVSSIWTPLMSI